MKQKKGDLYNVSWQVKSRRFYLCSLSQKKAFIARAVDERRDNHRFSLTLRVWFGVFFVFEPTVYDYLFPMQKKKKKHPL